MIGIGFLEKSEKDKWLPKLFALYYSNMSEIAPSGLPFEEERKLWLSEVSPALDKAPRQVILCRNGETLLGYIQYYTRNDLIMVEELQIRKDHQRTALFFSLCRFLARHIPQTILQIEAFAHKENQNSLHLMEELGMYPLEEDSPFVHLRGSAVSVKNRFLKRTQ